jgi:hypothetical protein
MVRAGNAKSRTTEPDPSCFAIAETSAGSDDPARRGTERPRAASAPTGPRVPFPPCGLPPRKMGEIPAGPDGPAVATIRVSRRLAQAAAPHAIPTKEEGGRALHLRRPRNLRNSWRDFSAPAVASGLQRSAIRVLHRRGDSIDMNVPFGGSHRSAPFGGRGTGAVRHTPLPRGVNRNR